MSFIAKAASNYRGTQPALGKFLVGLSGVTATLAAWSYIQAKSAQQDIEFRKKQLAKPIYKLSQEQMINPPWNKGNLKQWLYRRVEVTGRPIHRLSCMIPRSVNGGAGFQSVVPLVARENDQRTEREGLNIALGFIPFAFRHIGDRYRIENVQRQTFVGFVSTLQDLSNGGLFQGNAVHQGRLKYNYADLDDLATSTGLKNKKQASVAVIERLFQTGDLNERRGKRRSNDCDFALTYPYYKTQTGALQAGSMPWDYVNKSKTYLGVSLISLIVGASVF